jgi:hypothetical protein
MTIDFAFEILKEASIFKTSTGKTIDVRIGINSGPIAAGIIGERKFAYHIFGDTVNTASRMQSNCAAGFIQISPATYELLVSPYHENCPFIFEDRGDIDIKGKGPMHLRYVICKVPADLTEPPKYETTTGKKQRHLASTLESDRRALKCQIKEVINPYLHRFNNTLTAQELANTYKQTKISQEHSPAAMDHNLNVILKEVKPSKQTLEYWYQEFHYNNRRTQKEFIITIVILLLISSASFTLIAYVNRTWERIVLIVVCMSIYNF